MAKATQQLFRDDSLFVTAQPLRGDPSRSAVSLHRPVNARMGYVPCKDPIEKFEDRIRTANGKIRFGVGAMLDEEGMAVHQNETQDEKECRENLEEGRGYVTDLEEDLLDYRIHYAREVANDAIYAAAYNASNSKFWPDDYKKAVASGDIIDENNMCKFPPTGSGSTVQEEHISSLVAKGPAMNDDLIPEATKYYQIENEVKADGTVVKRSEESKAVQLAIAREEAKYTPSYLYSLNMIDRITAEVVSNASEPKKPISAAPAGIDASVSASAAFNPAAKADTPPPETQPQLVGFKKPSVIDQLKAEGAALGNVGTKAPAANDGSFLATGTPPAPAP